MPYSTADGGNKGIDISAPRGTPIYAAGAGKVVYVGNQLRGYGNLIMIKHSEDYITAYAHNDTMLVNNGQSVKAGQKSLPWGALMRHLFACISRFVTVQRQLIRYVTCCLRAASQNADGELISSQQRDTC